MVIQSKLSHFVTLLVAYKRNHHQSWLHRLCGPLQSKNAGFLVQNYWEFQDGDRGALSQVWGLFECGVPYDFSGHMPMKLSLIILLSVLNIWVPELFAPHQVNVNTIFILSHYFSLLSFKEIYDYFINLKSMGKK